MSEGTVASRWNLDAIEEAYRRWQRDPASVDESWRYFFEGFALGAARPPAGGVDAARRQTGVVRLIYAYREIGHFLAHLDPLNDPRPNYPLLELSEFGLSAADMDKVFDTSPFVGLPRASLRDLIKALRDTYCRTIGVEYMHIQDLRVRRWLQERMEPRRNRPNFGRDQKLRILKSLHYAELFERFLQTRYTGQKRFSLEGAETLIPILEAWVEKAPDHQIRELVIGMAHRGRLNVLANILRKPYEEIFAQFEENYLPETMDGDGDVKYHVGFSGDRVNSHGLQVHLSLAPNPSHLEIVDPIVEGRTRAKQTMFDDRERKKGVPILIHGDAAFAGQGLVAETLNLSQLEGYTTGGTLHVVVNNQIGFTTAPADARSTTYCTDVGKMIQAPVFHVNGEDPEACVYVAELALEFRQTFGCDVIIDMYCYRRLGHNEGDDPSYTQPVMYAKIKNQPKVTSVYADRLVITGDLTADEAEAIDRKFEDKLTEALHEVKKGPHEYATMHGFDGRWHGLSPVYSAAPVDTGAPEETLRFISEGLVRVPEDFTLHPKLAHQLQARHKDFLERKPVDWAFAEMLAFGSLLLEKTPVRLSGQDSRRGTFSQRHSVYFDYEYGYPYVPLNHLRPDQAGFQVYDSTLSETAVLGFEFGYSMDAPDTLVMWEAQFGDFSNGAQVVIDQFVASSESKWQRDSGLAMLLPHGYEGAGPEHSSARLERFLQLCADDNMQVVMASTPAQHFHMLRRQMRRNFRKPLIVMTPKSMLRAKLSPVSDLVKGRFQEVIDDATASPERIRRVVLCSGKVYHELAKLRTKTETDNVAIVRVEQFYPFPEEPLRRALARYRNAEQYVWAQEESQNMGAWWFMEPRLRAMGFAPEYVGRDASASPATGSHEVHRREQEELVDAAIRGPAPHLVRAAGPAPVRVPEPAANGPRREEHAVTK
jgi:2-oxoglutarate dehydrogenase E1 component